MSNSSCRTYSPPVSADNPFSTTARDKLLPIISAFPAFPMNWLSSGNGSSFTIICKMSETDKAAFCVVLVAVKLPWGSKSTNKTRNPFCANKYPIFAVVVVFATPPFWFVITIVLHIFLPSNAFLIGSHSGCL